MGDRVITFFILLKNQSISFFKFIYKAYILIHKSSSHIFKNILFIYF